MGTRAKKTVTMKRRLQAMFCILLVYSLLQTQVASTEDTIVLRSTGGAIENHGNEHGEFVKEGEYNGHAYYRQRDTECEGEGGLYLFKNTTWSVDYVRVVGPNIYGRHQWVLWNEFSRGRMRNTETSDLPPQKGWQYSEYSGDGLNEWVDNDTTLFLEFNSLSPCKLLSVEGDADIKRYQPNNILGNYKIETNRWSVGRPIYKLVKKELGPLQSLFYSALSLVGYGEVDMFLLFIWEANGWVIQEFTTDSDSNLPSWIFEEKGTNSPTDASGRTILFDLEMSPKTGNITVKCLE